MILKSYGLSVLDLDLTKVRDAPISHNLYQIPSLQEWYLVQIMQNWCISEFCYVCLGYIYNSVKLCVRSLGKVLDCFDSYVGVKQGEPLSPLLFILFLNDVADELNVKVNASSFDDSIAEFQNFILLFADDTLLLANTVAELQLLLNKLKVYCKKWNITVNINKTKAMLFKCSNRPEQFELF